MKAYKGFNKDMTCYGGFQYEEGKSYHEDNAKLCNHGFHACEYPLDCFNYFPPAKSVFCEVELDGITGEREGDTKICGTDIKIGAKMNIAGLIKASFDYVKVHCENNKVGGRKSVLTGGDRSALTGGYQSALTGGNKSSLTGGDRSALTGGYGSALTGGDRSALTSGYGSALTGGDRSALAGGYRSALAGGDWSALTGGDRSALAGGYMSSLTGGDRSALAGGYMSSLTGGDRSALTGGYQSALTGGEAAIMRGGPQSKFKGSLWAVFACEIRDNDDNLTGMATAVVDGKNIKPNTWYKCVDGKFVELEDTND